MSSADDVFDEFVADVDGPMFIVTAANGDEHDGCLVGFVTQSSIDPPQLVVWLSKANRTFRIARDCDALVVHLVRDDQLELADLFGGETGDEVDKLAGVEWRPGPGGAPILADCDWIAGRVVDRLDAGGDHVAFVLAPTDGAVTHHGTPTLHLHEASKRIDPGHEA